ncbi:Probable phytol kinase 1, chloroplastic [Linum grandiflorum]
MASSSAFLVGIPCSHTTQASLLLLSSPNRIFPLRRRPFSPLLLRSKGSPLLRLPPRVAVGVGSDLIRDVGATAAVLAGAYGLVRSFDALTRRQIIQQVRDDELIMFEVKQKTGSYSVWVTIRHILAIFQNSTSTEARYFAAIVPLINCLRLVIHGCSLATDEGLIKSVTREGKPEELLRGPLYYVLALIVCTLVFWRESPVGIISVAIMCGGDGMADIIGRRFGSMKLPYNQEKSCVGSLSMFLCGFCISTGMLYYYSNMGYFQMDWSVAIPGVALIALTATAMESLPVTNVVDDNISVPLVSMISACILEFWLVA